MKDFYGLLGVIGKDAGYILKAVLDKAGINAKESFCYENSAFIVSHNPIIKYASRIDLSEKSLILFGNPFFKEISLDEFLSDSAGYLKKMLLDSKAQDIALKFTNGAYIGVVRLKEEYIIFNDFFELQPLYYYKGDGYLIISTSFKPLVKYLNTELDVDALNEYLMLGSILSHKTIKKEINLLPAASRMMINKNGEIKIENYATYLEDNLVGGNVENITENVHEAFKKALRRLYCDKLKYCLNLTGGLDTRLIFLEWPDRKNLLTETAGAADSSDVLKAQQLVKKYGNVSLHTLENLEEDKYLEGFKKYYELCDNPLNLKQEFNYYHLKWKSQRGAHIRLFGSGEILGGENLYLNRKPLYLLHEMFFPYKYHTLKETDKLLLIEAVLKANYKQGLNTLLKKDLQSELNPGNILEIYGGYLGSARYKETFTERFRTSIVALAGYLPFAEVTNDFIFISPYYDREFIEILLKYHPQFRELRKQQLYLLKKYHGYCDLALDTTHLPVSAPYYLHKMLRVPRFILNIGFHKKVPIFQKGEPPTDRVNPYLKPENDEFRDFIKSTILNSGIFDKGSLTIFFNEVDSIKKFNFFTHHQKLTNLYLLFRLAYAYKTIAS
ncbi:MAG: hypothetical protein Q8O30_07520 [Candidatus Omnitrophota bacterium]|nr:hypothetical protein [Candidatus Omnitrophota bacterium]